MDQGESRIKEVAGWLTIVAFIGTAMATGSIPDALTAVATLWLVALVTLGLVGAVTRR